MKKSRTVFSTPADIALTRYLRRKQVHANCWMFITLVLMGVGSYIYFRFIWHGGNFSAASSKDSIAGASALLIFSGVGQVVALNMSYLSAASIEKLKGAFAQDLENRKGEVLFQIEEKRQAAANELEKVRSSYALLGKVQEGLTGLLRTSVEPSVAQANQIALQSISLSQALSEALRKALAAFTDLLALPGLARTPRDMDILRTSLVCQQDYSLALLKICEHHSLNDQVNLDLAKTFNDRLLRAIVALRSEDDVRISPPGEYANSMGVRHAEIEQMARELDDMLRPIFQLRVDNILREFQTRLESTLREVSDKFTSMDGVRST